MPSQSTTETNEVIISTIPDETPASKEISSAIFELLTAPVEQETIKEALRAFVAVSVGKPTYCKCPNCGHMKTH